MRELFYSLWIGMVCSLLILHISGHHRSFFKLFSSGFFFFIIKSDEQVQACIYRMIFRSLSEGLGAVTVGLYGQVCIRQVWILGAARVLLFPIPTQSLDWLKISASLSSVRTRRRRPSLLTNWSQITHPPHHPTQHPQLHTENNWLHWSAE